ncbi:MAG: hypothetical protein JWR68_1367 [Polaromonas sp.]|nr:hypothetical protein [Polaromonas sp.]
MLSAKALQQQVNGYIRMKKPTWAGKYGVA